MRQQVFASFAVGLGISAVLFIPLLVWQYRKYGRFDPMRMLWTVTGYVYASAIVAFTIFPLPRFTGDFCERYATHPLWDPLRFPRDLVALAATDGWQAALTSHLTWEVAMNVVLFIPFGLLVRRLFEWSRGWVLLAGLGTSCLIEATQATGNWWLSPCPYRFLDTTDLITNTSGALLGIGLEAVTPRLLAREADLVKLRDRARHVTRWRRWTGMLVDAFFLGLAAGTGATIAMGVFLGTHGPLTPELSQSDQSQMVLWLIIGAWIGQFLMIIIPAFAGTGASLGQRTVYLAPWTGHHHRLRRVARAMAIQGSTAIIGLLGLPGEILGTLLLLADVVWVGFDVRGLSYRLSGCLIVDSRALHR